MANPAVRQTNSLRVSGITYRSVSLCMSPATTANHSDLRVALTRGNCRFLETFSWLKTNLAHETGPPRNLRYESKGIAVAVRVVPDLAHIPRRTVTCAITPTPRLAGGNADGRAKCLSAG